MRMTFRDELEIFYRMSGIFIQMLMHDAEKQNSMIRADVNFMENYKALTEMKDFEELVMQQDFTLVKKATMKATLPTLSAPVKVETVVVADEKTVEENRGLLRQVTQLKQQIEETNLGSATEATERAEKMESELAETKQQLEMKVQQTPAVQNMKKMLQEKNAIIAELRAQLAAKEEEGK